MKKFYSEKIIFLPNSYQPNEFEKKISNKKLSKKDFGLPDDKFIFCCFNNGYKISDQDLDNWSRILLEVKDSILWLAHQSDLLKAKFLNKFKITLVNPM